MPLLLRFIRAVSNLIPDFVRGVGEAVLFLIEIIRWLPRPPFRLQSIMRQMDEIGARYDWVSRAHTNSTYFITAGCPDINVHILFQYNLRAFFAGEQVRRLGSNYAYDVTLAGLDDHTLS